MKHETKAPGRKALGRLVKLFNCICSVKTNSTVDTVVDTIDSKVLKKLTEWMQLPAVLISVFISIFILGVSTVEAATPPATLITNTVTASYSLQGTASSYSASAQITTVERTPSTITFHRISDSGAAVTLPEASFGNIADGSILPPGSPLSSNPGSLSYNPINQITLLDGTSASFPTNYPIEPATQYVVNEPIIIEVKDIDQNLDSNVTETIFVTITVPETGDTEVVRLTETSPSSGIFRGAIPTTDEATSTLNGKVTVARNAKISVNYRDSLDSTDISATAALVDPIGNIALSKQSSTAIASVGETLTYTLGINSNNFPNGLNNLEIKDLLPPGFRYINESAHLNDNKMSSNQIVVNGRSLTFILGTMPTSTTWEIKYRVSVGAGAPREQAVNTAQAFATGEQSFVARASVEIRDELMRDTAIITGRVVNGCAKDSPVVTSARVYLETGQSSHTDREGFWHLEGVTPGTHLVALDTKSLPKGLTPLLCKNNTQFAGKADSQFVDVKGGSLWRADFHVQGEIDEDDVITINDGKQDKDVFNPLQAYDDEYAKQASEGFEVLWPPRKFVPPIASMSIAIKHSPKEKIELTLNDKKVSALNFHGSSSNKAKTVKVSRWRGVDVDTNNRENKLHITVKDKSGKIIKEETRHIHFSGKPAFAEMVEEKSKLLADGNSVPEIAVLIRDQEGFPMRDNTHVYVTLEDGQYQILDSESEKSDLNNDNLASTSSYGGEHKILISDGGLARIRLKPTTQSGEIRFNVKLPEGKNESMRTWIKPHVRDEWILVGLAEGTVGYNTLSGNMQTLNDLDKDDKIYTKGRVAFFAKGKVKGKYLLTVAYDSAKKRGDVGANLNGNIDPDAFYTIYGDNAQNQHEVNSSSKLYVKLEREQFYMLFGDYRTNMTVTELSRFERTLHGIHSEYKGRNYRYNVSLSHTKNKHQRDEIPGDGTSGEYLLSQPIIPNSEVVILETRDRFHPEKIISQRLLAIHADYEIDYDSHSLFFKFPIPGRDFNLNPNFIVVDYESETNAKKSIAASGRVAYLTDDGKTEIGMSIVHENDTSGVSGDLIGTDITYKIDDETELKAEIARSKSQTTGNAWLLEARKQSSKLTGRAYIRQQDTEFGLEQQNLSERGTRKIGVDGRYNLSSRAYVEGDIYRQENMDNDNLRDHFSLEYGRETGSSKYGVGIRHARELTNGENNKGTLLTLGGSVSPENGRVTLRANVEKNIAGDGANEAYPDRLIVGADIGLTDGIGIFIERELTKSDDVDTTTNRIGLSSKLWDGASLKSSLNQETKFGGDRTFATLGLAQHINITEKLSADLNIDHSKTMKDNQIEPVDINQPAVNGSISDDYTAFSVGLGWREDKWSWTTRLENRNGDREDKNNFRFGLIRQLSKGKDISAHIDVSRSKFNTGEINNKAIISLGSAWHPHGDDFTVLQRLDLKHEEQLNASENKRTRKIIHNIHVNKRAGEKTQISLHHGIKHTLEDEFNQKFNSTVDTAQLQVRRNISEKFDVGVHAGYLHDWENDNWQYNYGGSVGVTPRENMWLSMGYNLEGFSDDDFDQSEYTAQGPFLQLRYRADKDQLSKLVNRKDKKNEQEGKAKE